MSVVCIQCWRAIVLRFALTAVIIAAPSVAEETNGARNNTGYSYHRDVVSDVPWSIQVLRIDRTNQNLQLHTMLANGNSIGLNSIPDQIGMLPPDLGKPIAAINGDYYVAKAPYKGDPKGVQISRGELISAPFDWTCLWIDNAGIPTGVIAKSNAAQAKKYFERWGTGAMMYRLSRVEGFTLDGAIVLPAVSAPYV